MTLSLFFGKPTVGKGTLCRLLSQEFGLTVMSTGDLVRRLANEPSEEGLWLRQNMRNGHDAPDEVVNNAVGSYVFSLGKTDALLDGYPRRISQAEYLLQQQSLFDFDLRAIELQISDAEALFRSTLREFCPSCSRSYGGELSSQHVGFCDDDGAPLTRRGEDSKEGIIERLKVYQTKTRPVLSFLRSQDVKVVEVDCHVDNGRGVDDVYKTVRELFL